MRIGKTFAVAMSAALFISCGSTPLNTNALEQARTAVGQLSQNPASAEVASRELTSARNQLSLAETALAEKDQVALDHHSYLATRQAETGNERIIERDARRAIAEGEADRTRVLLDARNAELEARKALAALAAQETPRGSVLTLGDVLFDTGKAKLKPGADSTLNRVSDFMSRYPGTRMRIEGHTDSQGSDSLNFELSQRRALAVADALTMRGVPRDRIQTEGKGPSMPIASNDTAEGRQRNRRVEMVFSDSGGKFAGG
jgi:outer membrane protein OmpA-like peptidoglycan-associated protein